MTAQPPRALMIATAPDWQGTARAPAAGRSRYLSIQVVRTKLRMLATSGV